MCICLNLTCGDFCFEASLSESGLPFRTLSGYLTDKFRIKKRGATTIGSTKWVKSANLTHVNWTVGIFFPVVIPFLERNFLFFLEDHFFLAKSWQVTPGQWPQWCCDAASGPQKYQLLSGPEKISTGKIFRKKTLEIDQNHSFNQHSTNIQPTFVSCETKWGFPEIGIPPNHPFQ